MDRAGRWLLLATLLAGSCGGVSEPGDGGDDGGDDDATDAAGDDGDGVDAGEADADVTGPGDPVILSMAPDWGSTAGGTRVTINGSGFSGAGLTVTFGGEPGEQLEVESDGRLTVLAPPGPHEPVAVRVTSDEGSATSGPFRYLAPLYAADGRGGGAGSLYIVNAANATATPVGPILVGAMGISITGMELSPDGILYASSNGLDPRLLRIDPYTGAATTVGSLLAGATVTGATDLTFLGDRLLGWRGAMTEIDPATAQVTPFAAASGISIATAPDGTLFQAGSGNGVLSSVDPQTGALTAGPTMNAPASSVNSMTFVGNTLLASVSVLKAPSELHAIDPATGQATLRGQLPIGIDAVAGIPAPADALASVSPPALAPPPPALAPTSSPSCPDLTIERPGRRTLTAGDLLALGADRDLDGRRRRVVPLAELRRLSRHARSVQLISCSGELADLALDSPGLALTANRHRRIKLIDARTGAKTVLGDLIALRLR
jgi:hypothetical protein